MHLNINFVAVSISMISLLYRASPLCCILLSFHVPGVYDKMQQILNVCSILLHSVMETA